MKPEITCYCLDWHIEFSNSLRELLVDPVEPYMDIRLKAWDRDRVDLPERNLEGNSAPLIFDQVPPPAELLENFAARVVWIPMWDQAKSYTLEWWGALPKTLRVAAFSNAVAEKAEAAGLPTLRLRYYKNPQDFAPAQWKNGRTALYWNRTGLLSPMLLERLCRELNLRELIFRPQIDPQVPAQAYFDLPERIGRTAVRTYREISSQKTYLELLMQANIFIAPRALEGVGLTFLEAMASGCAVLAYDAPTMNEYIHAGEDGVLLRPAPPEKKVIHYPLWKRAVYRLFPALRPKRPPKPYRYLLDEFVNLEEVRRMDLEKLGNTARERQAQGYALWKEQVPQLARFILEW